MTPRQLANVRPALNTPNLLSAFRVACVPILLALAWNGATAGEHTVTSRVTDINGNVQATAEELEAKLTFLEHSLQLPRTLMIE